MTRAPFAPLITGGEYLLTPPPCVSGLRARMAANYGVRETQVLPVRGRWHGIELILRRAARDSLWTLACDRTPEIERLAAIYGLSMERTGARVRLLPSPGADGSPVLDASMAKMFAMNLQNGLLVVDESAIEFSGAASVVGVTAEVLNLYVLRSLETAYGLAGAPVGAIIAHPELIEGLEEMIEPYALPTPMLRLAETVLAPSRLRANETRIADTMRERARMSATLSCVAGISSVETQGPWVVITIEQPQAMRAQLARFGIEAHWLSDNKLSLTVCDRAFNDAVLSAWGANVSESARRAEFVRDTNETRIAALVDFDLSGPVRVETGIAFYDHMLEQVASHAGFALTLTCEGDLDIDAHHTIEDCALVLGGALKKALGTCAGISRFGFVLPMDEAQATVAVDLGGRPFSIFEGEFSAPLLGQYPTEMTAHVFRSLAQSMGAAIHVEVKGTNDHHKTEACFKAFGRAFRQAIQIEGNSLPSTKGVIG